MEAEDRIFNPSRQTTYLLGKAEQIGPHTRKLCELMFEEQGRPGQRRMQGVVNLARKYEAGLIESAETAIQNGLRSYKSFCRLVAAKSSDGAESPITQDHALIRPASDYGAFFDRFAAKNDVSRENLPRIWQNADWLKVVDVFGLEVEKQGKGDDVWLRSPFTDEEKASLHVHLKQNVYNRYFIIIFFRPQLLLQPHAESLLVPTLSICYIFSSVILLSNMNDRPYLSRMDFSCTPAERTPSSRRKRPRP